MRQLLLLATLSLFFFSEALAQTKQPTTTSKQTVVEIAATSPDHSTLVNAVQVAGLTETLKGKGPFTIFAPTNKAFEKLMKDESSKSKKGTSTPMDQDTMNRGERTQRDTGTWNQTNRNNNQDTSMNRTYRTQQDTSTSTWNQTNRNNNQDTSMNRDYRTQRDTSTSTWNQTNRNNNQDTSMNRAYRTQQDTSTWSQSRNSSTFRDTVPSRTSTDPNQTQTELDSTGNMWTDAGSRAKLVDILNYHVVKGNYDSNALKQAIKAGNGKAVLTTVNGAKLTATLQGSNIVIQDVAGNTAKVTTADLKGSNGVIHVIDKVVSPTADSDKK